MAHSIPRVLVIVVLLFCGASSLAHADSFSLDPSTLTRIDVPGASATFALGINNAGQIVGTYEDDTGFHGFTASGDHFTTIEVPGTTFTQASGINNHGQIVGNHTDADGAAHGYLYDGNSFTSIDVP